ncbi:MAG: hypothetical protein OHK0039_22610 [Bacteroidia bacterium]
MANRILRTQRLHRQQAVEAYMRRLLQEEKQRRRNLPAALPLDIPGIGQRQVSARDPRVAMFLDRLRLAVRRIRPLRQPERWRPPRSRDGLGLLVHLARYLYAYYPVPAAFDELWWHPDDRYHNWFLDIGRGYNLTICRNLPLDLTKKMAHYAMQASRQLGLWQALRWGQVRGMGGTPALAYAVVQSSIGEDFGHEDFWVTVIRFLCRQPDLRPGDVCRIVAFLRARKFDGETLHLHGQTIELPPLHPGLSMKGRSLDGLLREVQRWEQQREGLLRRRYLGFRWGARSPVQVSHDGQTFVFEELGSVAALFAEGRIMRHCAASYSERCRKGDTALWSLRQHEGRTVRRLLTLEVAGGSRPRLVQVKGRANRYPTTQEMGLVRRWCQMQDIAISPFLIC